MNKSLLFDPNLDTIVLVFPYKFTFDFDKKYSLHRYNNSQ